MNHLLAVYQEKSFFRVNMAIGLLLISTVIMAVLFQGAINEICAPKAAFIFVSSILFWILFGAIATLLAQQVYKRFRFWPVLLIIACVCVLSFNQFFVRNLVIFLLHICYGCNIQSEYWLPYLISNSLLSNAICFVSFSGYGIWMVEKKHMIQPRYTLVEKVDDIKPPLFLDKIVLKNGSQKIWLDVNHINWIEAENNCIVIHTTNKKYVSYQTLKAMEQSLDPKIFLRIHRSTLVNKSVIKKVLNHPAGDATLTTYCGQELKISRTFRKNLDLG